MKTVKRKINAYKISTITLMILFAIFPVEESKPQFVVSDPGAEAAAAQQVVLQSQTLANAIEGLKVAKESYDTYLHIKGDLTYLKDQAVMMEQRLHNINNLQDLKIDDVMNFLSRTSCFFGNGYYYLDNRYLYMADMLMRNILSCSNDQLYMMTYAGMRKKMVDQGYWKVPVGYAGSPQGDIFQINQVRQDMNKNLGQARALHDMTNNAYQANSLDVSQRMKGLSASIDSLGTRMEYLSKCESCNYSEYERVMLYQKGLELHMQAMQYNNEAHKLEKDATALTKQDASNLAHQQYRLLVKECMVFRKY